MRDNDGNAKSQLKTLIDQSIHIIREATAELEQPALLFSGGKDSTVLAYLARQAFWPTPIPFPALHVDTGHNFPETLEFRDDRGRPPS
jgi:sulfate adenylyltransferase subunit 2